MKLHIQSTELQGGGGGVNEERVDWWVGRLELIVSYELLGPVTY